MKASIRHETRYVYSEPVFLDPHTVRLHPRSGCGIRVLEHRLEVDPETEGRSLVLDLDGNTVHHLWFGARTKELVLITETDLEVLDHNPYNFLVHPPANTRLPVVYAPEMQPVIAAYLNRCSTNVPITAFASSIAQEVAHDTVGFVTTLNQRIHQLCERIDRMHGPPKLPQQTLKDLHGSCRDLAVVFIDSCRALGLAARFVSGYTLDERPDTERELHAWGEVYLPGAGWRGFDPSLGAITSNSHVPVAAGRLSALAAPVSGSFRGASVKASLDYSITINIFEPAPVPAFDKEFP
jgi:transglutaminase-like putative cysteine protease